MNRSLLQPSPSKRGSDYSNAIRDGRSNSFRSTLSSYTEVMIETNDQDVPFIAIYKPDIKKEQRRVQAITSMDKCLKRMQLFRINLGFSKLTATRLGEQNLKEKLSRFEQLFAKMTKKRVVNCFWKMMANKLQKKNIEAASKFVHFFQTGKRRTNIREAMNRLKMHNLQVQLKTLQDQSELSKELTIVKNELFLLKQQAFGQQFIETSKNQLRLLDSQAYVDNLRQSNYQQSLTTELARWQQIRAKRAPKKKELLIPQQVVTVMSNSIKAYQSIIAQHLAYEQQLRQQLQGYANTEGITQLTEQIRQKDSIILEIDNFLNDLSKMDAEIKRFAGEKLNSEKIMSLISQHEKRLEIKVKKMEGIVPKIGASRTFLSSIICAALKRWGEEKQSWGNELEELIKIGNEENSLKVFIQKIREKTSIKTLAQLLYGYHQQISNLQQEHNSRLSVLQNEAVEVEELRKEIIELNRKSQMQRVSITNLLSFIRENESRISSNQQIKEYPPQKLIPVLQPILTSVVSIFRQTKTLQDKNFEYKRQIHLLQQRESAHQLYSETKIFKQIQTQTPWKIADVRNSEISLAERFLQPLNELIEGRKEDLQLKHQIINIQGKIQEIINHNVRLQEDLLKLQEQVIKLEANDKAMQEISARNTELKQENARLKEFQKKYNDLLKLNQSVSEVPKKRQEQVSDRQDLLSKISQYEYRIRQLSLVNAELSQRVASLKESHSQFSSIASSNLQLSEKINEIYKKSTSQPLLESNEQQLMKQTEMMKEILTLKLQGENQAMTHLREISSLRSEINSYQTIISKFEIDLMQKETQLLQQEGLVKTLQHKYREEREVNEQLKARIDKFQQVVSIETTNRFKAGEGELTRLKDQCYRIYQQLQKSVQTLQVREKQIKSLQTSIKQHEELIMNLKQQKERYAYEIRNWQSKYSSSQQLLSKHRHQLTQVKSQLHTVQMQLHKVEITQTHSVQSSQIFQSQLQEKQTIITNLLEQSRVLNSSFTSQLHQLKQEYIIKQQSFIDRLAQKDARISRLQIEIGQKMSTITSLQQLISLYSNGEQEGNAPRHPFSRDKEIQYLNEQIKSLEEFLDDINTQYRELEIRYQQEREKSNHDYILSPQRHKDPRQSSGFLSERRHKNFNESHQSIRFQQSFKEEHINRQIQSNESLAYSTEIRGDGRDIFLRMRSSESLGLSIQLIYNLLLNVAKVPSSSSQGEKIWRDISDLRTMHTGEALFLNLQAYCRQFIASCDRRD